MRERWALTQSRPEEALDIGRKTAARWEAGCILHQHSLEDLLRAIDQFLRVLAVLVAWQSVEPPGVDADRVVTGEELRAEPTS